MAEENSSIEKLAEMIKDHQHIVFFGGAGVSERGRFTYH